jgi:hypothetical protein
MEKLVCVRSFALARLRVVSLPVLQAVKVRRAKESRLASVLAIGDKTSHMFCGGNMKHMCESKI